MKSAAAPLAALLMIVIASGARAADEAPQRLGVIEVSATPLPVRGLGIPLTKVPASVQTLGAARIDSHVAVPLPSLLQRALGGVSLSNGQNNPWQPDLSFRGFDASPLLGTPEALSVYVDGVRVNEPFGDVVNFDLIPMSAIAGVTLISGSNPVYGLNTLGGALSFETKSGFDFPGFAASAYTGSFGARGAGLQGGGQGAHWAWYLAGNRESSDGWAAHNPGRIAQVFAKGSYRDDANALDLAVTADDNRLSGNQSLPLEWLDDPDQSYTWPDWFHNRLFFATLNAHHRFGDTLALAANLHDRRLRSNGLDSNVNDDFDAAAPSGVSNPPAFNDFDASREHAYGGALQLVSTAPLFGRANHFAVGASIDDGDTRFAQQRQPAAFDASRQTVGIAAAVPHTLLRAHDRQAGVYFTDTLSLNDAFALTLAGRWNHARIELDDRLGTALDGDHSYARFNPEIGLTWNPGAALTVFASYGEGTRTPSPSELTCADPAAPCSLPNAFIADPPLAQVVAHSGEIGARGSVGEALHWNASLYRTDLDNDLLFVSLSGLNGFYQNIPRDRRQGAALGVRGTFGAWTFAAHYDFVEATYQSTFTEASPDNSSASPDGLVTVRPGDRMPDIPRQSLKLSGRYAVAANLEIGAELIAVSSRYAHGDENNADRHGQVPGHAVIDLDLHWRPTPAWDVFVALDNALDQHYATYGELGEDVFAGPARDFDPSYAQITQFRAMAAPRALRVGFRYRID